MLFVPQEWKDLSYVTILTGGNIIAILRVNVFRYIVQEMGLNPNPLQKEKDL